MGYKIDVPFLTKSGTLPSESEKLGECLRAFMYAETSDPEEITKIGKEFLDCVPADAALTVDSTLSLQCELIGGAMRWMFRTSPYYHNSFLNMHWNGTDGLSFAAPVFRFKTTIPQLLGTDWFSAPANVQWVQPGNNLPAVPRCRFGGAIAAAWQFKQLQMEYGLQDPRVLRLLPVMDNECRFRSEQAPDHLYGLPVEVFEYPQKQSPAQWVPHLAELCKHQSFQILLTDGAELPLISALVKDWDAPTFDLLTHFTTVDDAVSAELLQAGITRRCAMWWPGGGDMPALFTCKFGNLHTWDLLQWVDHTRGKITVTDFFSFTCPVYRAVTRFPVGFQTPLTRCLCGRRYGYYVDAKLQPTLVKSHTNIPVSIGTLSALTKEYLGPTGWNIDVNQAPKLVLTAVKASADAKAQLRNVLTYHGMEVEIVDL